MPKKAMIHIQKMAPGPPIRIAPQAPTMLPVPTWAAMAVASAWKELMPPVRASRRACEKLPKTPPQPFSEAADLHEASADGEEQAGTHQQKDQDIIREIKVDGLHDVQQCVHGTAS